jgi:hypothetical protein
LNTVVDGDMSVGKANLTATQVEEQVKKEFDEVTETKVSVCALSAWLPFEDACKAGNSSSGLVKFIYFDCCTFDAHVFIEGLGFRITSRH